MNTSDKFNKPPNKTTGQKIESIESWWGEGEDPDPYIPLVKTVMETEAQAEYEIVKVEARAEFEQAIVPARIICEQARDDATAMHEQEIAACTEEFEQAIAPFVASRTQKIKAGRESHNSLYSNILDKARKENGYPQHNESMAQSRANAQVEELINQVKRVSWEEYEQATAEHKQKYEQLKTAAGIRYKLAIMTADIAFIKATADDELVYCLKVESSATAARHANRLAKMESIQTELLDITNHL